jgi:hypothetical protein
MASSTVGITASTCGVNSIDSPISTGCTPITTMARGARPVNSMVANTSDNPT